MQTHERLVEVEVGVSQTGAHDAVTAFAIGGAAYLVAAIAHETIGHPVMTLLFGGKIQLLTSMGMIGTVNNRTIDLAGPIANLVVGILALNVLHRFPRASAHCRFFLWLAAGFNLFWGAGYLMYCGVLGNGDWLALIRGLQPLWLWRGCLILVGAIAFGLSVRIIAQSRIFVATYGTDTAQAIKRHRQALMLAYLSAGVVACAAAWFNPQGKRIVWEMAAPSSLLAGIGFFLAPISSRIAYPGPPVVIKRSMRWIVACAVMMFVYIATLGPGIRF